MGRCGLYFFSSSSFLGRFSFFILEREWGNALLGFQYGFPGIWKNELPGKLKLVWPTLKRQLEGHLGGSVT